MTAITTILTIVNPVGALGPFIAMTLEDAPAKRRSIALRAALVSGLILAGCTAVGGFVFKFYGITIPALKIAGGVLLFFVGFDMINARPSRSKQTEEERAEGVAKPDVAVFPLAIPLLSGPGAIVSVFMLADKANTFQRHVAIYLAIVFVSVVSWVCLREAHRIVGLLGQIGINVMSRLMGVMLAAIAVQFMIDGLREALPALARI